MRKRILIAEDTDSNYLPIALKRYHRSVVSGTIVALEAVPSYHFKRYQELGFVLSMQMYLFFLSLPHGFTF